MQPSRLVAHLAHIPSAVTHEVGITDNLSKSSFRDGSKAYGSE